MSRYWLGVRVEWEEAKQGRSYKSRSNQSNHRLMAESNAPGEAFLTLIFTHSARGGGGGFPCSDLRLSTVVYCITMLLSSLALGRDRLTHQYI